MGRFCYSERLRRRVWTQTERGRGMAERPPRAFYDTAQVRRSAARGHPDPVPLIACLERAPQPAAAPQIISPARNAAARQTGPARNIADARP